MESQEVNPPWKLHFHCPDHGLPASSAEGSESLLFMVPNLGILLEQPKQMKAVGPWQPWQSRPVMADGTMVEPWPP